MTDTNRVICDVTQDDSTMISGLLEGCAEDWTPRAVSVTLNMPMTVDDPAAFVANEASKPAVEEGIAAAAGVSIHKVKATLTVPDPSRRLQGSDRRLQGTVDVSAEIQAENAAAVADLQTTVAAIEPAAMTTSLNTALESAGLPTVEVTELTAAASEAPTRYVPPTDNTGGGSNGDDDFATKHGLSLLGVAFIVGSLTA
jgi:hypothetical protein